MTPEPELDEKAFEEYVKREFPEDPDLMGDYPAIYHFLAGYEAAAETWGRVAEGMSVALSACLAQISWPNKRMEQAVVDKGMEALRAFEEAGKEK